MTIRNGRDTHPTIFGISAAGFAILIGTLGLTTVGLLMLYAVDQAEISSPRIPPNLFRNQIIFFLLSLSLLPILRSVKYPRIGEWAYPIFFLLLVLLAAVPILGKLGQSHLPFLEHFFPKINNSYRWIRLGFFSFQPSEFIKIAYILGLARYLRYRKNYRELKGLMGPFALTLVPMILIFLEPDLGTVMLFLPVLFVMLYAAGARIRNLTTIFLLMVAAVPVFFSLMEDYQKARIVGVALQSEATRDWLERHPRIKNVVYKDKNLNLWNTTQEGYHLYHSKTAIGSGTLSGFGLGKGPYMDGTRRLSECHNDFVFSIIAHQFGFIGAVGVILMYLVIAVGLVEIATEVTEPFGRMIVVGVLAMLLMQAGINIGMTVGLLPITGLTLPFISYGGSSLLTYYILIGLALSVDRTRPIHIGPKPFEFPDEP